jgi:hypothetical protein
MRLITIEVKDESMTVHDDKLKGCREVWRAAGLLVYVKGPLSKQGYEQARHIAIHVCEEMHIPVISLKKTGNQSSFARQFETQTRRMF